MAGERRQKVVLAVIAGFFMLFAAQLVNLQVFGNTKPVSLASAKTTTVAKSHGAKHGVTATVSRANEAKPGLNVRFQKWWQRTVQARVATVPSKAKRLADRVWRKLGAA